MFRILSVLIPLIHGGCVGPQEEGEVKGPCDTKKYLEEYHRRWHIHPDAGPPDAEVEADEEKDAGGADVYLEE